MRQHRIAHIADNAYFHDIALIYGNVGDKSRTADPLEADALRQRANRRRTLARNLGKSGFLRAPTCARIRSQGIAMAIWEMRPGDGQGRPVLVAADKQDVRDHVFVTDGTPRDWAHRPPVEFYTRVPRKKQREPANVMPFAPGTFVLDARAVSPEPCQTLAPAADPPREDMRSPRGTTRIGARFLPTFP